MKNLLWIKSLREIVFSDLTSTQYTSMWSSLQHYYATGISDR